jgi:hypothetical protein
MTSLLSFYNTEFSATPTRHGPQIIHGSSPLALEQLQRLLAAQSALAVEHDGLLFELFDVLANWAERNIDRSF